MKYNKTKRMHELKHKRAELQLKLTACNNWLLKNFNHPDRAKVYNDKTFYECEISQLDKKLHNLKTNKPELGHANHLVEFKDNNLTIN